MVHSIEKLCGSKRRTLWYTVLKKCVVYSTKNCVVQSTEELFGT